MIPFAVGGSPGKGVDEARLRAGALAAAVLGLLLAARLSWILWYRAAGQAPFTVALFVIPLMYAFPGPRRLLDRHRWPVLAVQGVLTWAPFSIFGGGWQPGIDGLLAGLVLLLVAAPASWLLAGGLLAADVTLRATVTGLPAAGWFGLIWVLTFYVDDALLFFGLARLAQIVGEAVDARRQAADFAVARERLQAAEALRAAIGQRLGDIGEKAAAARRALSRDAAQARAQIVAAGVTAREAIAEARAVAAGDRSSPGQSPAVPGPAGAVIGERVAWAVLVTVLLMFTGQESGYVIYLDEGVGRTAWAVGIMVLTAALQLHHSQATRQGRRPRFWLLTLGLQAVLVYAFAFPFIWVNTGFPGPFLAGSILLLVPGWWRWAGYAAVVVSYPVLLTVLPLTGSTPGPQIPLTLFYAATTAEVGLMVYGLSRLAGLAAELEGLRGELARVAAVAERLRVARDVHDLLGLGLSAIALKADLITALIGRDNARAAAEMEEMARICTAAHADTRLVTANGQRLSLAGELAAARQILASGGIKVDAVIGRPLPAEADEVLAPVLREAVTNILRHSAATACEIEVTADDGTLRMRVGNDGVTGPSGQRSPAGLPEADGRACRGLANLSARVEAAGGRLTRCQSGGWFELTAEIPLRGPFLAEVPGEGSAVARPLTG